jgi:cyclopropane-fatty-acyl-phospholipid synthase
VRLQGWEEFDGKVDRIVCVGAFEHFGHDRYDPFFDTAYSTLPDDGSMLLHTICGMTQHDYARLGLPLTLNIARFVKFIMTEIFPGGRLPSVSMVEEHASKAGFQVSRVHSLQPHYAKTLDLWAAALEVNRDDAIAVESERMYDRYMKYLTGCADLFRGGYLDVNQFTLTK